MHDTSATTSTLPELPSDDPMAKVGPDIVVTASSSGEATTMAKEDPAMDSEALSTGSDFTAEARQSPGRVSTKLEIVQQTNEKVRSPQPVTPESPKVSEEAELAATEGMSMPDFSEEKKACEIDVIPREIPRTPAVAKRSNSKSIHSSTSSSPQLPPTPVVEAGSLPEAKTLRPDHQPKKREEGDQPTTTRSKRSSSSRRYDDDGSSSDDDSYFATHLPSPKSGRSFSFSSVGSGGAVASAVYQSNASRESDASLSFSDESDEDVHPNNNVRISPMIPPKGAIADMNLFPQRITRMHSVSSLVSSDSSHDGARSGAFPTNRRASVSSVSSQTTSGTTSDPGVRAELHDVAVEGHQGNRPTEATGRRSPVMGQHGTSGYFFSSPSPVMSPPPIMQGYMPPHGISHPQPQVLTREQMAAWATSGVSSSRASYGVGQEEATGYGATAHTVPRTHPGGFQYVGDNGVNLAASGFSAPGANIPSQGPPSIGSQSNDQGQTSDSSGGERQYQEARGMRSAAVATGAAKAKKARNGTSGVGPSGRGFKVYWQRWIMLLYMSVLNLLSDWTCYSVAPISLLTEQAFGNIDPERLVVIFLGANAVASISEPIILSRLGLRRTVLFGALLLMIGSIVKSGGVPPLIQSDITMGHDEWRLYLGFFLVGLSQPLYQCTPTLLSSSWFPEEERTMATGVALNANQLGIGFAFVFGTLLVAKKEDIIPYFGLLSTISTIVFLGALIQFDDAPPTPPSASARVVRGTLDVNLPSINTIVQSVRGGLGRNNRSTAQSSTGTGTESSDRVGANPGGTSPEQPLSRSKDSKAKKSSRKGSSTRRRATGSRSTAVNDNGLSAPSSARAGSTKEVMAEMARIKMEAAAAGVEPPSSMMPGRAEPTERSSEEQGESEQSSLYDNPPAQQGQQGLSQAPMGENPMYPGMPGMPPPGMPPGPPPPGYVPPFSTLPHPHYQYPYWDPRFQQQMQQQQAYYQQQYYYYQQSPQAIPPHAMPPQPYPPQPYYFPPMAYAPPHLQGYDYAHADFPAALPIDEGAEPVLTITPHHLDIDIKDDQVIRSLKACFARHGFMHALVAFTASGIVINTLSTYMDYLVRLNGAPRAYTGIVGGTFQFVIMISSLIIGKFTDQSRAYYSVTIAMLVLGAFGLAECGVSLDADRGDDLRWCLVVVAALVGPLQPVSTELGVDVVYPLSENTVLVIQQLFSNLLSALFIPVFKALKDVGSDQIDDSEMYERPEYTFSFYLLIVIHTAATVFFATFNGKYLRYEHELERKAEEEEQEALEREKRESVHPFFRDQDNYEDSYPGERQPLVSNPIV